MTPPKQTEPTVIIVEDDSGVRDSLDLLIASTHWRCVSFASGEAFLSQPLPQPPCCVLLDMNLPGRNGLAVQSALNSQPWSPPVLFVSAEVSMPQAISAMKAGAMDFLQKPFDPDLLLRRVELALSASIRESSDFTKEGVTLAIPASLAKV